MRRIIVTLIALSFLTAMSAPAFVAFAQNSNDRTRGIPFHPGQIVKQHKLPANARVGSTPERQAALNNLTPIERENVRKMFNDIVAKNAKNEELKKRYKDDEPTVESLVFTDKNGRRHLRASENLNPAGDRINSVLKIKGTNQHPNLASMKIESDSKTAVASSGKSKDLELELTQQGRELQVLPLLNPVATKRLASS